MNQVKEKKAGVTDDHLFRKLFQSRSSFCLARRQIHYSTLILFTDSH